MTTGFMQKQLHIDWFAICLELHDAHYYDACCVGGQLSSYRAFPY
jgi:hypothetical protein